MTNHTPISVVMSVYNAEKYLTEAIDSILNQTFKQFEFIIVNDGSTDSSLNIIKSFNDSRIKIIDQENKGLSQALNIAIKTAKGNYIARLDADDIALPTRFEKQFEFLEKNLECVALGSNAIYTTEEGQELYTSNFPTTWTALKEILPLDNPFLHSAVIFRKNICIKCGYYDETIKNQYEDIILWNRMSKYGELRNLKEVLIKYRFVPNAITNKRKKTVDLLNIMLLKILKYEDIEQNDLIKIESQTRKYSKLWKQSNYHSRIGGIYLLRMGFRKKAIKHFIKALQYYPINLKAWFFLGLSIQPNFIINKWNHLRQNKIY